MKRILPLVFFCLSFFYFNVSAQTTVTCNANFTWTASGQTVKFLPDITERSAYILNYWSFGDGHVSDSISPYNTFPLTGGVFLVTHYQIRKNLNGVQLCIDSVKKEITIPIACADPQFTYIQSTDNYLSIQFTNTTLSLNANDSISWTFGDGTHSGDINTTHVFANAGTYHICLLIKKRTTSPSNYCITEKCIDQVVAQPCDFTAGYTATADSANKKKINFVATSSLPSGTTATVSWFFGDNSAAVTGWTVTHEYAQPGKYYVCAKIQSGTNTSCYKYKCDSITVLDNINLCDFTAAYTSKADSVNKKKIVFTNTTVLTSNAGTHATWSFGDASPNVTTWDATHEYALPGKYKVCLIVYNGTATNCVKYTCDSITVLDNVIPCDFTAGYTSKADSANKKKINFVATSSLPSGTTATVSWFFGDGTATPVTGWTVTHTFTNPGKYYVCAKIQSGTNTSCYKYKCDSITVLDNINLCDFTAAYTSKADSVNKKKIVFTNTTVLTSNAGTHATWSFGDGSANVTTWDATHEYALPGKYKVCLIVYNGTATNCVKYTCDSITVLDNVIPCDFTAGYTSKADSINTKKISFTATAAPISTSVNILVTWNFGDGSATVNGWTATHEYAQYGKYYVCARIQYGANCVKYKCDSITVVEPIVPCNFTPTYSWQQGGTTKKVYFANTTNLSIAGAKVSWSFDDGTAVDTSSNPIHEYAQYGKYYVCLRIAYGTTCVKYKCDSINVIAPIVPCDFVAGYTWAKDTANYNKINFSNTTVLPTPNAISSWNFGDGSTIVTSPNASHEYAQPGRYYVCLTVNYGSTCIKYKCDSITVVAPPIPCDFVPAYTRVSDLSNSKKISFTNTTVLPTTSNLSAVWNFGDGTASVTSWNAIHEYAQPGKYYVCLRVAYGTTCVKYTCDSITVLSPPVSCTQLSLFTYTPSSVNHQLYYFTPANQSTDVQYTWTFGDGTGSHDIISNHQFANNQTYNVCLTAFKNANCAATTCNEIRITPVPCDTIKVSYGYHVDQYMQNKIYFYAVSNVFLQNQNWTITKIGASTTTALTISQNNPLYNFTDTGYYNVCLRAVSSNGCVKEYCNTIHIASLATACELQAFPNPATTQVNVYVSMDNSETIHAYLYNVQTVLLQQKDQQGFPGNNVVSISTASLPQGYYTIKLIYGNKVCFAKFQKL